MNIIESQWESYRLQVLPVDASRTQVRETKRAFFAGAAGVMAIMRNLAAAESFSDDVAEQILIEADTALREFNQLVFKGRA
jgi:hypothetical protein